MREQKSRANWLNTENSRCHRTVYITTQNVTSKLQIGLSPEMGWCVFYYYRKQRCLDVYTVAVHEHCSKTVLRPLLFSLHSWCLNSFCSDGFPYVIAPAFSLLHFPPLLSIPAFSTPAFSTPAFSAPPPFTPKASRGKKTGTVYRTRSQSTSGSEEAPSAPLTGLGLPDRKRFYCFLRLTECLSWTKNR